jgi:uncharacterized protein YjbI with pentapeptide repeats
MSEAGIVLKIEGSTFKADFAQIAGGIIEALVKTYFAAKTLGLTAVAVPNAVTALFGALKNIKREESLEYRAWLLVLGGLLYAVEQALVAIQAKTLPTAGAIKSFALGLTGRVGTRSYSIEPDFFSSPNEIPLLGDVADELARWLKPFGATLNATEVETELRRHFATGLHRTWMKDTARFGQVEQALNSPFTEAIRLQRERDGYLQYIEEEFTQLRLIGQEEDDPKAVTLAQVFVPLRVYYEKKITEQIEQRTLEPVVRPGVQIGQGEDLIERHVMSFFEAIDKWGTAADRRDSIRIISGGPGIGKSSSMRALAVRVARQNIAYPILIPLQKLEKPEETLRARIEDYLVNSKAIPLTRSPLEIDDWPRSTPILLIFDGLDELVRPGKDADEIARNFIVEVRGLLDRENGLRGTSPARALAIVTGRVAAAGSAASMLKGGSADQVLFMMRFAERDGEAPHSPGGTTFIDPEALLSEDQRLTWWNLWRESARGVPTEIPTVLLHDDLFDVTVEPLLLYFIAFVRPWETEAPGGVFDRNGLYDRLLRDFYVRECGKGARNFASEFPEFEHYELILQAMALAAWHDGSARTGTIDVVDRLLRDWDEEIFASFKRVIGSEKPAIGAALAFYMKPGERPNSFEFLHTTFAEYLTSRRIVEMVKRFSEYYDESRSAPGRRRKPFDHEIHLRDWLRIMGPRAIDNDLLRFLRDEIARLHSRDASAVRNWREALVYCMSLSLREGLPAHALFQLRDDQLARRPQTFREAVEQARNAEEALLATLNATILPDIDTRDFSPVDIRFAMQDRTSLGAMIQRLRGQRVGPDCLVLQLFTGLNLSNEILHVQDLYGIRADKATFREAELNGANLSEANLQEVNFDGAILWGVDFTDANLEKATFRLSKLGPTDFSRANLENSIIEPDQKNPHPGKVDFTGAKLKEVDLSRLNRAAVILDDAELDGATLPREEK